MDKYYDKLNKEYIKLDELTDFFDGTKQILFKDEHGSIYVCSEEDWGNNFFELTVEKKIIKENCINKYSSSTKKIALFKQRISRNENGENLMSFLLAFYCAIL